MSFERQKSSTKALIRFCRDHGNNTRLVDVLDLCLQSLEDDNVESALRHFKSIPLGGMGCFNDWLPPPVHKGETHDQAFTNFDSLVTDWALSMKEIESGQ